MYMSSESLIFSITNQKGGVGKTTTAVNLATALAQKGHETLLIDLDAQTNSSSIFIDEIEVGISVYAVFKDQVPISEIAHTTRLPKLHVLPAHIRLAEIETTLASTIDAFFRLKEGFDNSNRKYDMVIIDCPPSLGLLTVNAFICSRFLIVPLQASKFSMDGLVSILDTHRTIQKRFNPSLEILGALITLYNSRTAISQAIIEPMEQYMQLFKSRISRLVAIEEAHLMRQTIFEYAPNSKSALEYQEFAEEILDEIKKR